VDCDACMQRTDISISDGCHQLYEPKLVDSPPLKGQLLMTNILLLFKYIKETPRARNRREKISLTGAGAYTSEADHQRRKAPVHRRASTTAALPSKVSQPFNV
jgi:hypothetical protein